MSMSGLPSPLTSPALLIDKLRELKLDGDAFRTQVETNKEPAKKHKTPAKDLAEYMVFFCLIGVDIRSADETA